MNLDRLINTGVLIKDSQDFELACLTKIFVIFNVGFLIEIDC